MQFRIGKQLLLPCEVKPGPFSNERMVRVRIDSFDWLGFVPISALKEPVTEGHTLIRTLVTDINGDSFEARLPGHAFSSSVFRGSIAKVKPFGPLQTRHSQVH